MDRPGDPAFECGHDLLPPLPDPRPRRHRQDRPPRRLPPARPRRARAHRLALGRRRPSTGRTAPPGRPRCTASRAAYISYFPDIAVPGAPEAIAELARLAVARRHAPARAAVRPRRGGGAARRGGAAGLRRRLDDRALQLVQPELQRGLPARVRARGRGHAPGERRAGAVRRRRRHRRRRRRGAHRRPATSASSTSSPGRGCSRSPTPSARSAPPAGATSASRGSPSEDYASELAGHGVPPRRDLAAALPVRRGPRRPQREPRRRRAARARPPRARLPRVRPARGGRRGLERGVRASSRSRAGCRARAAPGPSAPPSPPGGRAP